MQKLVDRSGLFVYNVIYKWSFLRLFYNIIT